MLIFKQEVSPPLPAIAQQARKVYASSVLGYNVSALLRIAYGSTKNSVTPLLLFLSDG